MSTQKQTSGRRSSQEQRHLAKDVLELFGKTRDVTVLVAALEHFSKTGDFTPFSVRNQNLQKRPKFYRLLLQARQLHGKAKDDFIGEIAFIEGMSEETAKRMLETETETNLQGADKLYYFLERQPKVNPV